MPGVTAYTVGWICAIGVEYVAAQEFLDEEHPPIAEQHPNDDNLYTLGTINKHNVVIACLPDGSYGTNSAAAVARDLLRTFPNIKFGLMVGIGGGCPTRKRDIRLGDVVVSSVSGNAGAVLQYDFGKATEDEFRLTKHLDAPPRLLAAAVQDLRAIHERRGNGLNETVASVLQRNRRLKRRFTRPPDVADRLFKSTFHHIDSEESCESTCALQEDQLILREERNEDEDDITTVHYGLIASGNSLIKSAKVRDQLVAEKGVLCFEMEAAGLIDHFKCLVIRGICDYCDTHKNDDWQGFAAMVAAAYAKDLLARIPPSKVAGEQSMKLSQLYRDTQEIKSLATDTKDRVAELADRSQANLVRKWLSPPDPSTEFHDALKQRHANTGKWFLESKKYHHWKSTPHAFLWLHARPGAGKTVLSSTIIENLQASEVEARTILYFYFTFNNTSKQTLQSMFSSLVYQLYINAPATQELVHATQSSFTPSIAVLSSLFKDMIRRIGLVSIVLDALDECPPKEGANRELVAWIKDCKTWQSDVRILVTSRYEDHIRSQFTNWAESSETLELDAEHIENDIASYIHCAVRHHGGLKRWENREDVQNEIEEGLAKKADGMFRWVSCQLTVLESCRDLVTLRRAIKRLPRTLDETYSRILNTIPEEDRPYTVRILQILAFSEKPIRLDALIDALAVEVGKEPSFVEEHRMEDPEEIVAYFSGLARLIPASLWPPRQRDFAASHDVQLAHSSVREWLVQSKTNDPIVGRGFEEFSARESICMIYLSYLGEVDCLRLTAKAAVPYDVLGVGGQFDRPVIRIRPLTRVAEKDWVDHARFVAGRSSDVRAKASDLLQRRGPIFDSKLDDFIGVHIHLPWWLRLAIPHKAMLAYALVQACHHGLPNIAEELIWKGAVPEGHDVCLRTPLQAAAAGGCLEVVQLLVNKYEVELDRLCQREDPSTALAIACRIGHESIIQFLLEQGADPNARRDSTTRNHEVRILDPRSFVGDRAELKHYACVSPLHVAARHSSPQIASLLIDYGANVNLRLSDKHLINDWKRGPLEVALSRNHTDLTTLLLSHGAQLDPANTRDALEAALSEPPSQGQERNRISLLSMFLRHAAAMNWHGIHRWAETILGYACCARSGGEVKNSSEMARVALQYGPNVDAFGYKQLTALQHACDRKENPHGMSLVSLLLTNGADANVRASSGQRTPLQRACHLKSSEIVALLLANGADPDLGNPRGNALHFACKATVSEVEQGRHSSEEIIRNLLCFGADINAGVGSKNGTPLKVACQQMNANAQIVQLLLDNGANVQARDSDGMTALQHACCRSGNLEIVRTLLDSGADWEASGGKHGNALRIAALTRDLDVFEMLLEYVCGDEDAEQYRQGWICIDRVDESDESFYFESDESESFGRFLLKEIDHLRVSSPEQGSKFQ